MATTRILKKSWTTPAERAFLNSSFLVMKLNETKVLVSVVPTFAPMIMGIASLKPIEPEATIATTIEVLVLLLCIKAVINKPINKPIKGLEVS